MCYILKIILIETSGFHVKQTLSNMRRSNILTNIHKIKIKFLKKLNKAGTLKFISNPMQMQGFVALRLVVTSCLITFIVTPGLTLYCATSNQTELHVN